MHTSLEEELMTVSTVVPLAEELTALEILEQGVREVTLGTYKAPLDFYAYYRRFYRKSAPPSGNSLDALHDELLAPFKNDNSWLIDPGAILLRTVSPGTCEYEETAKVVNFAYSGRYLRDRGEVANLAGDRVCPSSTVVAIQEMNGRPVVLAALKVAFGENPELFRLFETSLGYDSAGRGRGMQQKPGEFPGMAFHPIFEVLKSTLSLQLRNLAELWQRHISREIWRASETIMRDNGVEIRYAITGEHALIVDAISKSERMCSK